MTPERALDLVKANLTPGGVSHRQCVDLILAACAEQQEECAMLCEARSKEEQLSADSAEARSDKEAADEHQIASNTLLECGKAIRDRILSPRQQLFL